MRLPIFSGCSGYVQRLARRFDAVEPSGHCGTSWHEPFVRDSWGDANFSEACKAHDRCYDTCGNSKDSCDRQFERDMEDECRSTYDGGGLDLIKRNACIGAANTYAVAVEQFGGDAYHAAQQASNC
jgi:hypothetical protein